MTEQDMLECLIISKISGNITDEENHVLQLTLANSDKARKLQDKIIAELTTPEALKVINAPSGKSPFSTKRQRIYVRLIKKIISWFISPSK